VIKPTSQTSKPSVPKKRIAVTGGNGYVGSAVCNRIIDQGHELLLLSRSRPLNIAPELYQYISYDLEKMLPLDVLTGVDCLIHLAHEMEDTEDLKINEGATRALLDAGRHVDGLKFIYVSSQSASADAPTLYGQIKYQIESLCEGPSEFIVRPGFVYGGAPQGAYGLLVQILEHAPIFPVIGLNTQIQPIHVDDLCQALMTIIEGQVASKTFNIAENESISFRSFLKSLARHRLRRRLLTVPVPLWVALLGARICRLVPGLPNVSRERIIGLTGIKPMNTKESLAQLNLKPRDMSIGFQPGTSSSYRALIAEGQVVIGYIMGGRPPAVLVRRYMRAVRALGDLEPLEISRSIKIFPSLLKFQEPLPSSESRLSKRLRIAVSIVEMSPEGATLFAAYAPSSQVMWMLQMILPLALEAVLLPLRMLRR
jgi:NADH dehydrogenase